MLWGLLPRSYFGFSTVGEHQPRCQLPYQGAVRRQSPGTLNPLQLQIQPAEVSRHTQSIQGMTTQAISSSLGEVAILPNSQKQTQKIKQKEEREDYVPNKITRENLKEKNLK